MAVSSHNVTAHTRTHTHTPQKHCKHTFHKTLGRYKVNHSTIKTAYSTPHYRRSQSDDGVYTGDVPKNTCCGAATYLQSPPMRGSSSRKHWCHDFFFFLNHRKKLFSPKSVVTENYSQGKLLLPFSQKERFWVSTVTASSIAKLQFLKA